MASRGDLSYPTELSFVSSSTPRKLTTAISNGFVAAWKWKPYPANGSNPRDPYQDSR